MISSIRLVAMLLLVSPVLCINSTINTENYVNLITDLQEFHRTSGVVVVYYGQENSLSTMDLLLHLSQKQRYSVAIRGTDLITKFPKLMVSQSKLLFVVQLNIDDDLEKFQHFMSESIITSFHVWLVLFSDSMSRRMRELCSNPRDNWLGLNFAVQMLVKCGDESQIREWFAIGSMKDIKVQEYLEWSQEHRLVVKNKHPVLYQRRRDLGGITFRTALVDDTLPSDFRMKFGDIYDQVSDVMYLLASVLNFTMNRMEASDNYGFYNETEKQWNGLLGRIWNKSIDVSASELMVAQKRIEDFDFTMPTVTGQEKLYFRTPDIKDVPWNAHLKTFSNEIWLTLAAVIIVSTTMLTLIEMKMCGRQRLKNYFFDNYMNVWSIYCQQGLQDFSNFLSLKLAYTSIFLSAFVLLSVYSGSLTSYVAVSKPRMPFKNMDEFIIDNTYELVVVKGEEKPYYFYNVEKDFPWMSKGLRSEDKLPESHLLAFEQVCRERIVFLTHEMMFNKLYPMIPCDIASIHYGRKEYTSMALKKHNPLTNFLSYYILRFYENGLISRINKKNKSESKEQKLPFNSIDMRDATPLFVLLICGCATSLVVVMLELFYRRFQN